MREDKKMKSCPTNSKCAPHNYAIKNLNNPRYIKRFKRCGCWQSISNIKTNHQPYSRKCLKHKFLDLISGIIRHYKYDGFQFWRIRSFIKHDLLRG